MNEKDRLRREALARRDAMPMETRIEKSVAISAFADAISLAGGTVVSGFLPIRSEPDPRPLMASLFDRGARLCLPVVIDRQTIVFRDFIRGAELVPTGFGTYGPSEKADVLDPEIMLMPLAAFDGNGNRLGYGAGHYDRAIARLRAKGRKARLIGIAFDIQRVEAIPFEPHDVPLDAILTERGLRPFQPKV